MDYEINKLKMKTMLQKTSHTLLISLSCLLCACSSQPQRATTDDDTSPRWGDLGDGTYANPVLLADYSDPDVIRVGEKYYMTCSEFHFMGMPILESEDMVNWRIIGQIYRRIDLPQFENMHGYADGTWAPALRYHDGRFWMFVCMPHSGLYMSSAEKPEGPWTPLHQVVNVDGWEDPCPFWDEDGQAYLGHSRVGAGPIIIHRMSPDGTRLLDEGQTVYEGPVAEGTKFLKKDGYYYLSIPEGGVVTGWQTVLRSKDIYGPYEGRRCLETGSTNVNGPHQGSLVDTPDGEWWFYHFQSHGQLGRVLHLQPVTWNEDGFPFIGEDYDGNGIGEPVPVHAKPQTGVSSQRSLPQTSDDFKGSELGAQWAWNHNPVDSCWSLTERQGWLTLHPLHAEKIRSARNTLTQKVMGYEGIATVKLDYAQMQPAQRAGLAALGSKRYAAGIEMTIQDGKNMPCLYVEDEGESTLSDQVPQPSRLFMSLLGKKSTIWLRLEMDDVNNTHQFSYSLDGEAFTPLGEAFSQGDADWKGYRVGLFTYTTLETGGPAYFTQFQYK